MAGTALNLLQKIIPPLARVGDIEQHHLSITQTGQRGAGVIAIVALAGNDPDGVSRHGQFHNPLSQPPPHQLDDFFGGLPRCPGGFFPLAHLLDR